VSRATKTQKKMKANEIKLFSRYVLSVSDILGLKGLSYLKTPILIAFTVF
jgi:hypothetical protein